jgi:uncharacterized protein
MGVVHSLIWFGDILFAYAVMGFLLLLFRKVRSRTLLRWAIGVLLLPTAIDLILLPFFGGAGGAGLNTGTPTVHVSYPDLTPETVLHVFQNGSVGDLFILNVHNLVWKYLGYFPSGQYFTLFGIFLLGYYLASIGFFTHKPKPVFLFGISFIIGVVATLSARIMGGSLYQWPPTLSNILFKFLLLAGQIFLCLSYISLLDMVIRNSVGKRILNYLKPMGRMALSNYLSQTVIMIALFYNVAGDLFGRIGIITAAGIAVAILIMQIVASNLWLRHFRFGPMEWLWRSLTYKRRINIRYDNA